MAKDKAKKHEDPKAARKVGKREADARSREHTTVGDEPSGSHHRPAAAHGKPARVDTSLPSTRAELAALHAAARVRRNAAPLGSEAFRAAVDEIARIEIRVADIDRAADPPLG